MTCESVCLLLLSPASPETSPVHLTEFIGQKIILLGADAGQTDCWRAQRPSVTVYCNTHRPDPTRPDPTRPDPTLS